MKCKFFGSTNFPSSPWSGIDIGPYKKFLKKLFFVLSLFPTLSQAWGWKVAEEFKLAPWYRGAEMTVEYKNYVIDFNPAGPSRDLRLRGKGYYDSISTEQCETTAEQLLKRITNVEQYQLAGNAFDGRPKYFAHKRLFLISMEPAVLLVVPYRYELRHPAPSINNTSLRHDFNSAFNVLNEAEKKTADSAC